MKFRRTFLACLLLTCGLLPTALCDNIAIFYALDADQKVLAEAATSTSAPLRVGERSINIYTIFKHKVYTVKMGSGPVETAVSAEALLSRIPIDFAFSVGPVGSLGESVKKGLWYRVADVMPYQKGTYQNGSLNQIGKIAMTGTNSNIIKKMDTQLDSPKPITVASGEIFLASSTFRANLAQQAGADAVEMNLFGLLAACRNHQVPIFAWRVCSDDANESAKDDFRDFVASYDGHGAKALLSLVNSLPINKMAPDSYDNLRKLLPKE